MTKYPETDKEIIEALRRLFNSLHRPLGSAGNTQADEDLNRADADRQRERDFDAAQREHDNYNIGIDSD